MIKHITNIFIVIAACLGVAAFILVLVKKQNCQTKESLTTSNCDKLDDKSKSKNIEKYNKNYNVGGNDNMGVNKVSRKDCKGLKNYKTNECCKVYLPNSNPAQWFVRPYETCKLYYNNNKHHYYDEVVPPPNVTWGRTGQG